MKVMFCNFVLLFPIIIWYLSLRTSCFILSTTKSESCINSTLNWIFTLTKHILLKVLLLKVYSTSEFLLLWSSKTNFFHWIFKYFFELNSIFSPLINTTYSGSFYSSLSCQQSERFHHIFMKTYWILHYYYSFLKSNIGFESILNCKFL